MKRPSGTVNSFYQLPHTLPNSGFGMVSTWKMNWRGLEWKMGVESVEWVLGKATSFEPVRIHTQTQLALVHTLCPPKQIEAIRPHPHTRKHLEMLLWKKAQINRFGDTATFWHSWIVIESEPKSVLDDKWAEFTLSPENGQFWLKSNRVESKLSWSLIRHSNDVKSHPPLRILNPQFHEQAKNLDLRWNQVPASV